ncbi:MAG TPA: SGNH/GDSL hydrolase family protein [Planctomycetota bacterium]|nr:SGNH/GDSL hydrolase family protein [Planctomycetota bacterium]
MAAVPMRARRLLAGLAVLAAAGVAAAFLSLRDKPRTRLVDNSSAVSDLLLRRRGERSGAELRGEAGPTLPRGPMSEEDAALLFPLRAPSYVFDPQAYYVYRPHYEKRVEWRGHPKGRWIRRTNAAGLRMDAEVSEERPDLRVLVVGDSQTDGVCDNAESYCALLQAALAARHVDRSVEVLNAAVMGYSFYNYLGAIEKHLALDPQVVVVAFFSGNDFLEMLDPLHYFERTLRPPRSSGYWERIQKATQLSSEPLITGINQALYFQQYPDELELAFRGARLACAEIEAACRARGAAAIFVHVPSAFDTSRPEARATLEQLHGALELSEHHLHVGARLAERLIRTLRDSESEVLDLAPELARSEEACYWQDFHINLHAHERIAALLLPRIEAAAPFLR